MIEEKQNNIVGEIARTAVIFALTSVGISKTPLGKSKVGALASILAAFVAIEVVLALSLSIRACSALYLSSWLSMLPPLAREPKGKLRTP